MYKTDNLILRHININDLDDYTKMNQDPIVMEFFPRLYSAEQSKLSLESIIEHHIKFGYGVYVIATKSDEFIGIVGFTNTNVLSPSENQVEILWRTKKEYWGYGYATEAALKCLEIGFTKYNLPEIVSFTAKINTRSQRIMQKIGMVYQKDNDFIHPKLEPNSRLNPHVLYKIANLRLKQPMQ